MDEKRTFKSFILDFLKGISLGISAAIAGLSAGTIAVVEGCYDTLIGAVSSLRKKFKESVLTLLPYFLGLLCGALGALIGIQRGYKAAPFSLTSFFAGFVLGSLPVAIKELKKGQNAKEKFAHILSFLLCLGVAAALGIVTALLDWRISFFDANGNIIWYVYFLALLAGFIGAFACVIPGISGSMSLMVIGVYYPLLNAFTGDESIWHSGNNMTVFLGILVALIFVVGAIGGVVASSKSMKYLLAKYHVTTFYGIFGLIIGSLISMYINSSIFPYYGGFTDDSGTFMQIQNWDYILGACLFVVSATATFLLFFFLNKKKKNEPSKEDSSKEETQENKEE